MEDGVDDTKVRGRNRKQSESITKIMLKKVVVSKFRKGLNSVKALTSENNGCLGKCVSKPFLVNLLICPIL